VRDLRLSYDGRTMLHANPLHFFIPQGNITALIGPNGSGKTTLLRALLGENFKTSGTIEWMGKEVGKIPRLEISSLLAYVPQEPIYDPQLTVRRFISLALLPELNFWSSLTPEQNKRVDDTLIEFHLIKDQ